MVGTLIMISKLLDGISDIIMGRIIDATKSKMGKARFWYFVTIIPNAVCIFLLFSVPGSFTKDTQYIYIFIIYTLMNAVFYTMNNLSYTTLVALVTRNQKDQFAMSSYSMLFSIIASMILASTTPKIAEVLGGGHIGWQLTGLIYAVISVIAMLIPFFVLKEIPIEESNQTQNQSGVAEEKLSIFKALGMLIRDKYFIIITLLYTVGFLSTGLTQSIGIYYASYSLGNAALFGLISLVGVIPLVIGMPFMPKVVSKFGMQKSNIFGAAISIAGALIVLIGQPFGIGVIFVGLAIKSAGTLPGSATYGAFVAAIDEHNFLKTGHRMTGSMFACSSVGTKIGMGVGTALCGWLLELGKFNGLATVQTSGAISTITYIFALGPLVCVILQFILYSMLDVEKANKVLIEEQDLKSNSMNEESVVINS